MAHHHQSRMGYRFHPTNIEIMQYLLGFARNDPLPAENQFMQHVNLYGDKEPWDFFEGANTYTRYFITQQKKNKPDGERCLRTVGNGTWNPQGKGKEVFDRKGRLMGYVKSLKYKPRPEDKSSINAAKGEWLMTEYSLYYGYVKDIQKKGYVICKIKKKKKKKKAGDKEKGVVNDDANMSDVEEFINSVLEGEDFNGNDEHIGDADHHQEKNIECVEGDEVEEHFLATLGCHHDLAAVNREHELALASDIDLDTIDFV